MPTSYNEIYFPVLLQALIAMTIAGALLLISFLLGKKGSQSRQGPAVRSAALRPPAALANASA